MWILIECDDIANGPGHDEKRRIIFGDDISVKPLLMGINVVGIGTKMHPCTPGTEGYHCPICHKEIKQREKDD